MFERGKDIKERKTVVDNNQQNFLSRFAIFEATN